MTVEGISVNGQKLLGWGSLPVPLATVAISLRFRARLKIHCVGADDWVMLFAFLLYMMLYATLVVWTTVGKVGWHQTDLNPSQLEAFWKTFFVVQIIYSFVGPAIKLSILLLYRRVFAPIKILMWATVVVGLLTVGWSVSNAVSVIVECLPVGSYWNPYAEERSCIDSQKFYWGVGISNFLLDFLVLCLPVPTIWHLHMPLRKRLFLLSIFSLGIFVCSASILRITYLWKINFADVSGTVAIPAIWTSLEPGLGVVAGCLPTIAPLVPKWLKPSKSKSFRLRQPQCASEQGQEESSVTESADTNQMEEGPST